MPNHTPDHTPAQPSHEASEPVRRIELHSADGTRLVATDRGDGPPVLIVHGGSSSASSWEPVAAQLSRRFRVLCLERRGYGVSDPAGPSHSIAAETGDVLALAASAGAPVLLVGHSSGGIVALETALASPRTCAGMLLYEPPVAVDRPLGGTALRRARAALDRGDPDRAMAIHLQQIVGMPRRSVALMRLVPPVRQMMRTYAAAQIADDEAIEALGVGLDRYAGLEVPALLLGGDRSPRHLRDRLDALAGVLPRVHATATLPGQSHMANLSAPGEVAEIIERFADSVLR
ncbi:alpha/beta fold hydrolase [Streptomyces roseoverticillatus]|uniref:Alpha/beta hydrolase n=1 Tax=Streptomyces roseoverticillatus TaxID=66429 RepID=A0ABV3IP62_9ACTN